MTAHPENIQMKNAIRNLSGLTLLGVMLLSTNITRAQTSATSTTSTTTSAGTVSQFSPDTIVVRTTTSPNPVSYSYSKTTTYVDETGNAVSSETVKSGAPVTVYYTQEGDKMVATKVVVRKTTTTTSDAPAATAVETKKTSTSTTTTTP
jgi:hypothetical protein